MVELFINLMDDIFWPGYAEELAAEDPKRYTAEFIQFCDNC